MKVCFLKLVSHKCICATLIPIRFTLKIYVYVEALKVVVIEIYPYSDFMKLLTLKGILLLYMVLDTIQKAFKKQNCIGVGNIDNKKSVTKCQC